MPRSCCPPPVHRTEQRGTVHSAPEPADALGRLTTHPAGILWVYLIECADNSYYVGSTRDVDRRLWEHHEGLASRDTRPRRGRPVGLRWCVQYQSIQQGFAFEKQLPGLEPGQREALIEGRLEDLPALSRSRSSAQPAPEGPSPPSS